MTTKEKLDFPDGMRVEGTALRRRHGSIIYKLVGKDGPFALKALDLDKPAYIKRQNQYFTALNEYHARSDHAAGLSVPIPKRFDQHGLLMEWVEAPLASLVLRRRFFFGAMRRELILRSAKWLRWFHGCFPQTEQDRMANTFSSVAQRMEAAIALRPDSELSQIAHILAKLEAMPAFPLTHGSVHGDFHPENLFMEKDRIIGIDFAFRKQGPLVADICRFMTHLSVYRLRPVPRAELREYGCAADDFALFAKHYGEAMASLPPQLFILIQFNETARRIAAGHIMPEHASVRRRLEHWILRRVLRHTARGVLSKWSETAS